MVSRKRGRSGSPSPNQPDTEKRKVIFALFFGVMRMANAFKTHFEDRVVKVLDRASGKRAFRDKERRNSIVANQGLVAVSIFWRSL